jgi:AbrB family looped-hinge helix DNA binding protein
MAVSKMSMVQERGQVTIPKEIREKAGLKKGDLVSFEVTKQGILISPQEVVAAEALEKIGEILKENHLTIEQLMESGREIRGRIVKRRYRLDPDK